MSQPDRYDAADLRCDACQSNTDIYGIMKTHDKGRWVLWDDYAALAAERDKWKSWADAENKDKKRDHADACDYIQMIVKQKNALAAEKEALVQQGIRDHQDWRSKLNFLEADYKAEVARLTAENERLRKAGDRLAFHAQEDGTGWELHDAARVWLATKEGGRK